MKGQEGRKDNVIGERRFGKNRLKKIKNAKGKKET